MTCGQCTHTPLQEVLRRQPCVDPPECAQTDDEIADQTLANFRACKDIGSCGLTKEHPTKESLCADPMYRDTLCRGTCGGCTPQPPVPTNNFLAAARRAQGVAED